MLDGIIGSFFSEHGCTRRGFSRYRTFRRETWAYRLFARLASDASAIVEQSGGPLGDEGTFFRDASADEGHFFTCKAGFEGHYFSDVSRLYRLTGKLFDNFDLYLRFYGFTFYRERVVFGLYGFDNVTSRLRYGAILLRHANIYIMFFRRDADTLGFMLREAPHLEILFCADDFRFLLFDVGYIRLVTTLIHWVGGNYMLLDECAYSARIFWFFLGFESDTFRYHYLYFGYHCDAFVSNRYFLGNETWELGFDVR